MNKHIFLGLLTMLIFSGSIKSQESFSSEKAQEILDFAAAQYQRMIQDVSTGEFPRSTDEDGKLIHTGSGGWTSGFYPGICWYLYEHSGNETFKIEATSKSMELESEKFNRWTHDTGFMLYCSVGNGYRLTGEANFRDILVETAKTLSTRYDPDAGCIKSWDWSEKWQFPVIIDNMMNLELLFKASQITGNPRFKQVAVSHANTTMKSHYREDYSCYHVIDFNPETGAINERTTHQGHSDESVWSRGQSWGLYGFTLTYRMTGNKKYLKHAEQVADFLLEHPNLPEDGVPYWDYKAPEIPNTKRDASAAAIMASALLELSQYSEQHAERYRNAAGNILNTLSGSQYLAEANENGNFLLKHSVGAFPSNSEVDVPLVYADYYFVEALLRYLAIQE